jgi:fibronectin type 3 domain-containing protein
MNSVRTIVLVVVVGGLIAGGIAAYPQIRSYFVEQSMRTPSAPHAIKLTWNLSRSATSYNIYRSSSGNGAYQKLGVTTAPPFFDFPVSGPAIYFYAVTAVSDKGESQYSVPIAASLP